MDLINFYLTTYFHITVFPSEGLFCQPFGEQKCWGRVSPAGGELQPWAEKRSFHYKDPSFFFSSSVLQFPSVHGGELPASFQQSVLFIHPFNEPCGCLKWLHLAEPGCSRKVELSHMVICSTTTITYEHKSRFGYRTTCIIIETLILQFISYIWTDHDWCSFLVLYMKSVLGIIKQFFMPLT